MFRHSFSSQWAVVPQAELTLEPRDVVLEEHEIPRRRRSSTIVLAGALMATMLGMVIVLDVPNRISMHTGSNDDFTEAFSFDVFHLFDVSTTTTTTITHTLTSTTTTTTRTSTTVTVTSTSTITSTTFTTTLRHTDAQLTLPGDLCSFDFDVPSATSPAAKCFCQLADNNGCKELPCMCPQGCVGTAWDHPRSVTFINKAQAYDCNNSVTTALLTIPKSYMRDIGYAKFWCPRGAVIMMAEMIREGFRVYQEDVMSGTVRQCLHSGVIASVPWLHLHTIGQGGFVDNMFKTTHNVWCHDMENISEARPLAVQLLTWAGGYKMEELSTKPKEPPSTCAVMGCGTWGPKDHCSCDPSCRDFGICCADYEERCYSNCKQIGCGNAPEGNNCTCEEACQESGRCCADAVRTCPKVWKIIREEATKLPKGKPPPSHATKKDTQEEEMEERYGHSSNQPSANQPYDDELYYTDEDGLESQSTESEAVLGDRRHSSCLLLGCGANSLDGKCSCHSTCVETQDCCDDFESTCHAHMFKKLRRLLR